jgi:hypothetical protein
MYQHVRLLVVLIRLILIIARFARGTKNAADAVAPTGLEHFGLRRRLVDDDTQLEHIGTLDEAASVIDTRRLEDCCEA